jgi:hypothetical protein
LAVATATAFVAVATPLPVALTLGRSGLLSRQLLNVASNVNLGLVYSWEKAVRRVDFVNKGLGEGVAVVLHGNLEVLDHW